MENEKTCLATEEELERIASLTSLSVHAFGATALFGMLMVASLFHVLCFETKQMIQFVAPSNATMFFAFILHRYFKTRRDELFHQIRNRSS